MKALVLLLAILLSANVSAQSDLHTILKGSELILSGLAVLKVAKSETMGNEKVIEKICVKNKLKEAITLRFTGKNPDGSPLVKEVVIPTEGKECLYAIPKGVYAYEIELPNKEIYKKGEYHLQKEMTLTIKDL